MKDKEKIYYLQTANGLAYGVEKGDFYQLFQGDIFGEHQLTEEIVSKNDCCILPPCYPGKVVCLGLNYQDHAREMKVELPKEPILFIKPSTSVIGDGDLIIYPRQCHQLHYEGELAVVIGKKAHRVAAEDGEDYIFGYTCANDITARDLQPSDGQWTYAKSFDTFCPLGPAIARNIDPHDLDIKTYLNGELRQDSHTSNLHFSVFEALAYISHCMTLEPGDIILTGTPLGVDSMAIGDEVVVEIEHIGSLRNRVARED